MPENKLPHEKEWRKLGNIGQPDGPSDAEMEERRQPQFIIDPRHVETKDDLRVRKWAFEKMKEHESKLTNKWQQNQIVAAGDVEPEDIDIRNVYDFEDMHWIIYRKDGYLYRGGPLETLFHIILLAKIPKDRGGAGNQVILCKSSFSKV